jgi:hypothetical protein
MKFKIPTAYRIRLGTTQFCLKVNWGRGRAYAVACWPDDATEFDDPVGANQALDECVNKLTYANAVIEPVEGSGIIIK